MPGRTLYTQDVYAWPDSKCLPVQTLFTQDVYVCLDYILYSADMYAWLDSAYLSVNQSVFVAVSD